MHESLREPFFSQKILQKSREEEFDREWQAEALFYRSLLSAN